MIGYLEAIVADRKRDLRGERELVSLETLQQMALERGAVRDFARAIQSGRPAIIAEIKRRSPSAGAIDGRTDAATVAISYEQGGAAAISVVTEPRRFDGSYLDIARVRRVCPLPVLCKDFVIDDFQVWKAAAFGADAILLIAAMLDDARLRQLRELASTLGMSSLVEVHDEHETQRALALGCPVIGINNRRLQTFDVDLTTTPRILALLPGDTIVVAESGYTLPAQVREVAELGVDAVLIGEHLMRSADRASALQALPAARV